MSNCIHGHPMICDLPCAQCQRDAYETSRRQTLAPAMPFIQPYPVPYIAPVQTASQRKRDFLERAAIAAMQGNLGYRGFNDVGAPQTAQDAVKFAHALWAELEKQENGDE